jgi:hypothetical protein
MFKAYNKQENGEIREEKTRFYHINHIREAKIQEIN